MTLLSLTGPEATVASTLIVVIGGIIAVAIWQAMATGRTAIKHENRNDR